MKMTTVKLNKSFVVNRKISCILILALVIISINNLCIRQVECQLEPIGAVLTVVPVTSILATAGLHALKLQALSHLLKMFGYDQSYVAKASGKGTAENPIGYQENLNYLLPYVPMLNISVKEEHLTPEEVREMDKQAVKTHPAMMLPGDYESIKSYRDVDIEGILRKAGIKRQPQIVQMVKNQPQGSQYNEFESQEFGSQNVPSQQQQKARWLSGLEPEKEFVMQGKSFGMPSININDVGRRSIGDGRIQMMDDKGVDDTSKKRSLYRRLFHS